MEENARNLLERLLDDSNDESDFSEAQMPDAVTQCVIERWVTLLPEPERASVRERAVLARLLPVPDDASEELLLRLATRVTSPSEFGPSGRIPIRCWAHAAAAELRDEFADATDWRDAVSGLRPSPGFRHDGAGAVASVYAAIEHFGAQRDFLSAMDHRDRIPLGEDWVWLLRSVAAVLDPLGNDGAGNLRAAVIFEGKDRADSIRVWILQSLAATDFGVLDFGGACTHDGALLQSICRVAWSLDQSRRGALRRLLIPILRARQSRLPWSFEELALLFVEDSTRGAEVAREVFSDDGSLRDALLERVTGCGCCLSPEEFEVLSRVASGAPSETDVRLWQCVLRPSGVDPGDDHACGAFASPVTDHNSTDEAVARGLARSVRVFSDAALPVAIDLGALAGDLDVPLGDLCSLLVGRALRLEFDVLDEAANGEMLVRATNWFLHAALAGTRDLKLAQLVAAELLKRNEPFGRAGLRLTGRVAVDAIASCVTTATVEALGQTMRAVAGDLDAARHWCVVALPWVERVPLSVWEDALRARGIGSSGGPRALWGEDPGRAFLSRVLARALDDRDEESLLIALLTLDRLVASALHLTPPEIELVEQLGSRLVRTPGVDDFATDASRVLMEALALGANTGAAVRELRRRGWQANKRQGVYVPLVAWRRLSAAGTNHFGLGSAARRRHRS